MLPTPNTLVWLHTGFLGDLILATGAFTLARRCFPQARHTLVTSALGAAALKDHPALDNIYQLNKRQSLPDQLRQLRALKYELSLSVTEGRPGVMLQAHASQRSSLICKYLGLPTIAYRESWLASSLADISVERVATLHESARVGLLLEPLGIEREQIVRLKPSLTTHGNPSSRLSASLHAAGLISSEDGAQSLAKHARWIGVAPGSVWGTKRWPSESFAACITSLQTHFQDARILLLGSSAEADTTRDIAQRLDSHANSGRVLDLAGKTNLDDLRWLIPRLDTLLANDSSLVHYASAFDTPTVTLFGPTVPSMGFAPKAQSAMSLEVKGLSCRPCSLHGPQECPLKHFRCMRELKPKQVSSAVIELATLKASTR